MSSHNQQSLNGQGTVPSNKSLITYWLFQSVSAWLFVGLLVFILWASFFEMEQSVSAQGQIIPSARTQIVQVADGGVLAQLLVSEGQRVEAGETLALLEKERAIASYEESLVKVMSQSAGLIRAKAEIGGYEPSFGENFAEFQGFVDVQKGSYLQRKQSLADSRRVLQERLAIANEVLSINQRLVLDGDTSQMEVLQSKREVSQLKGELVNINNDYYQQAQQEVVRLEAELASSKYQLEGRRSVLRHTELTSPVKGIVKYLKINTLGGVLRAGDELMQISPTDDEMLIEIKINPVDIGLLKVGLPVSISLDAFDYSIYGTVLGRLIYISSDTLTEGAAGESFTYYSAKVRINENAMITNPRLSAVALKPGMTVNARIRTGSRTIIRYILKPIYRGFSGALSER